MSLEQSDSQVLIDRQNEQESSVVELEINIQSLFKLRIFLLRIRKWCSGGKNPTAVEVQGKEMLL